MSATRTPQQTAAGQLVSAIQKEWIAEMGEPAAAHSEQAMDRAHEILQAVTQNRLHELLQEHSIEEFLDKDWVTAHAKVMPAIKALKQYARPRHPPSKPGEAG